MINYGGLILSRTYGTLTNNHGLLPVATFYTSLRDLKERTNR